jgi:hypothetical protein
MALSTRELQIFNDAFKLGFSKSFDGWNGETFKETNGILYNELGFLVATQVERKTYERELEERNKCGLYHPGN